MIGRKLLRKRENAVSTFDFRRSLRLKNKNRTVSVTHTIPSILINSFMHRAVAFRCARTHTSASRISFVRRAATRANSSSASASEQKSDTTQAKSTPAPSKVRVIESLTNDPYINLATVREDVNRVVQLDEEWIFTKLDPSVQTLFLWRNGPSVIIGRNQNPWKECHLVNMIEKKVNLVRRQSGGGAVYQDLGNAIFTFLSSRETFSKERNSQIIINALRRFGIEAVASGRNDMLTNGLKFSGSAYKLSNRAAIHHGTIMLSVDTEALQGYLNPNKEKLLSKGVTSVKSRVVNLQTLQPSLTYEALNSALTLEFCNTYQNQCTVEKFDENQLMKIPEVSQHAAHLRDWKWIYGETPEFNHHLERRFEWGIMDINFFAEDGVIQRVGIYSDSLYPQMIEALRNKLTKAAYDHEGIKSAISAAKADSPPECAAQLDELRAWLMQTM